MIYLVKGKVTINVEKIINADIELLNEDASKQILSQAQDQVSKLSEGGYADIDSVLMERTEGRFALDNWFSIDWQTVQAADEEDLGFHGIEIEED